MNRTVQRKNRAAYVVGDVCDVDDSTYRAPPLADTHRSSILIPKQKLQSRSSCRTSCSFQPALELLMVNDTSLLLHRTAAKQNDEIRNTANVKAGC